MKKLFAGLGLVAACGTSEGGSGPGPVRPISPPSGAATDESAQIRSVIDDMNGAFQRGDVEGVMQTYEPGAVVVGAPGKPVSGDQALRAMFGGFISAKARFTFRGHDVIQAGDLALHLAPWDMTALGPDGKPTSGQGLSVAVLRRQQTGGWRLVLDYPFGDSLLRASAPVAPADEREPVLALVEKMNGAFQRGDVEGVMQTYEPGAVVVGAPGKPVSGDQALRAMFGGFISAKARFTFRGHDVIQAGDLALHLAPWDMTALGPDGKPMSGQGLSVAVLRRQQTGGWRFIVDDPFGDFLMTAR